jgi:hypothetical protein
MNHATRTLQRYDPHASHQQDRPTSDPLRPPTDLDVLLLGVGNSGEAVTLRCQALSYSDGSCFTAVGLNNDRLGPRPVLVRRSDGTHVPLELSERLVLDGDYPRDRLHDDPLLARRYQHLLRGVPVFETYPRAGAGGHGHPAISALDIDLQIDTVLGLLRRALRQLQDTPASAPGQSALQRLVGPRRQRQEVIREKRIIVIGGGCGAMGNAAHPLLPYLIRQILIEQGLNDYQLWGVILGPRAFSGLTPFVRQNYRALLEQIEHLSRNGQRRAYRNDLEIALQQPPYDRVWLFDDPALPGEGVRVTEAELETFLDRAALSLYLVLRDSIWQTIASHTANDDGVVRADGCLRYLSTFHGVLVGVDRTQLAELLTAGLSVRVLEQFIQRFDS